MLEPAGAALLERLAADPTPPEDWLRLGERLRRHYPADLVATALTLHELRLAGRAKFSRAMAMFFTRPGLEQASSERIARWRAGRFAGLGPVADLCCGIGGDTLALAGRGPVVAVDRDPVHLRMAELNADAYQVGAAVTTQLGDVREWDPAAVAGAFIDPARRDQRGRMRAGHSEPPLSWCVELARRLPAVAVKAAPGLPHDLVPAGWEAEFIADGRDLKEAVLWSPALARNTRQATILSAEPDSGAGTGIDPVAHTLTAEDGPEVESRQPGAYLLDPNPAVTRAGLVEELARGIDAWKIDPRIGFLSTNTQVGTPFARTLRVWESAPWHERRFAQRLRELEVGAVDIRRRGLAGAVDQIHRRLRLHGERRATLVITRVSGRPWGLICTDVDAVQAHRFRATPPR